MNLIMRETGGEPIHQFVGIELHANRIGGELR